ncbi:chromosomal replication initiator protein DnaA [bacterium]|nr:chromosomal replication initiator protein DnaA [bacterium]
MIKKWEFIYAPCEKDARRYKIRIDGEEKDLLKLTKKIGKHCGKSFVPISKIFKWVFYIYNVDKNEKEKIENILKEICPVEFKEKAKKNNEEDSSETESTPSLEFILENIVSYDKEDSESEKEREEIKEEEIVVEEEEEEQGEAEEGIEKEEEKQEEPEVVEEPETSGRSAEIADILKEKELLDIEVKSEESNEIESFFEGKSIAEEILKKEDIEKTVHSQKEKEQEENKSEEKLFGELKLNPAYTFDSFVVGPNSRFTHAAALAVAENPGKIYNPLFIYGGVGLGKTHLLHAIGHFAQGKNKNLQMLYITAEKFIEDVIDAIRQGTVRKFRRHCRKFDILLVDDIQFLAEAESTQEEFFHTFNILYDAQKQIVITCDKPPKRLIDVEERLKSRFEWGLTADVKSPNLETRVAILKKKEENQSIKLDDDILLYIAGRLKSNIRELEGFLKRIDAYVQLTKQKITLDAIKTLLGELLPDEKIISEEIKKETKEEQKEKEPEKEPEEEQEQEKEPKESEKLVEDKEAEKKKAEEFLEKEVFGFKDKKSEQGEVHEEKEELKPIEKIPIVEEVYPTKEPIMQEVTENGKTFKLVKVGYFYPDEHGEDLKKIKKEFESVIEKHKLKFQLDAVFEKEYTPYEKVEYNDFVTLCKTAGVRIVIVLGPPKGKELKETEFSTALKAFLDEEKISLQFVPFGDIGKQFRFLNLVLDIVLVSHKK